MGWWNYTLTIIGLMLAGTILSGCISFRGDQLPVYQAHQLTPVAPAITVQYNAMVINRALSPLTKVEPELDKSRAMFVDEIHRLFSEAGIQVVDYSSSDPHLILTLYFFPDIPHSLAGQYYGYFAGMTLTTFPYYQRETVVLEADVEKGGQLLKQYSYEQIIHTWNQLLLIFALPFYDIDVLKQKAMDDLLFNFILDFQRDHTHFVGK